MSHTRMEPCESRLFMSVTTLADDAAYGATINSKGKLVVTMGGYNNAVIGLAKNGAMKVLLNSVSRHGETVGQGFYSQPFKRVRSIEVRGSAGDDSITLGEGIRFTTVHAGNGDDTIRGSSGESMLYGADGNDRIYGSGGNDSIYGEEGDDRLYGDSGDDLLDGGAGKDRLDGGKGRNKLAGGAGTDYLTIRSTKDKRDGDRRDRITDLT